MKQKPTKLLGWIILGVLAIILLNSAGLFSILESNTVDTYGITCMGNLCDNAKPTINSKLSSRWILYYNTGEDPWHQWGDNPYLKNFFYSDWDMNSLSSHEDSESSANVWFKGMTSEYITQLKSSSITENHITKYGSLNHSGNHKGLFNSSYITHNNKLDWWSYFDPYNDPGMQSWENDFFSNKTCWVEFNSGLGLIKVYGKTSGGAKGDLWCNLQEYTFLDDVFVPVNLTQGSQYRTIQTYTRSGAQEFSPDLFEVKIDFSKTEFPPTNQQNPNCNYYYWFDNNHNECNYKQFCGYYMYQGLKTFNTLQECNNALGINQTCTPSTTCVNGYYSICICQNNQLQCTTGTSCNNQCTSDSDCLSTQYCGDGTCMDNPSPTGNWYDFIFIHLFTIAGVDIKLYMGLIALVALVLIMK